MNENNALQKVIIYGDTAFAEQVYYQLETDERYKVLAFTVDRTRMLKETFNGLPVIPFQELKKHYPADKVWIFPAIGYSKLNTIRELVMSEIEEEGYKLLSYISKLAFIGAKTKIGAGCYIGEFVSIGIQTELRKGIILLPHTRIGHNNVILKNLI